MMDRFTINKKIFLIFVPSRGIRGDENVERRSWMNKIFIVKIIKFMQGHLLIIVWHNLFHVVRRSIPWDSFTIRKRSGLVKESFSFSVPVEEWDWLSPGCLSLFSGLVSVVSSIRMQFTVVETVVIHIDTQPLHRRLFSKTYIFPLSFRFYATNLLRQT